MGSACRMGRPRPASPDRLSSMAAPVPSQLTMALHGMQGHRKLSGRLHTSTTSGPLESQKRHAMHAIASVHEQADRKGLKTWRQQTRETTVWGYHLKAAESSKSGAVVLPHCQDGSFENQAKTTRPSDVSITKVLAFVSGQV